MSRFPLVFGLVFGLVNFWLVECQYQAPIETVNRGYNDRVEYVKATITPNDLDKGSPANNKARSYAQSMSPYKNKDDAGHCVAARLGGTGKETYNIIPQNPSINRGVWRTQVEAKVYDKVKSGDTIVYEIWPQYAGGQDTRPSSIKYKAVTQKDGQTFQEGEQDNPPPK